MIQGTFIPSEYSAVIKGKAYEGKCADVTRTSKFDGLSDMEAWGIIGMAHIAHKFDGEEYYTSLNKGESFRYTMDTFKMNGDRVIMIDKYKNDIPESKSGLMTYKKGMLTVMHLSDAGQFVIAYKKQ